MEALIRQSTQPAASQSGLAEKSGRSVPTIFPAFVFGIAATMMMFALHPHLGVRDIDGYAYIMGARGLHARNAYRDLSGAALNHWPPAYSLLLSPFRDTIGAAKVVNYLSFGATVGLLFDLLRLSAWSWKAATGFTLALSMGFFRLLANEAHADIITYAAFLAALGIAARYGNRALVPSLIFALLIPVKLIAAVFLPAAIGSDRIAARHSWKDLFLKYTPGTLVSFVSLGSILLFNWVTIRSWIPASHAPSSPAVFSAGLRTFVVSLPRTFFFNWHGSATALIPRLGFVACMILTVVCMCSLRPDAQRKWLRVFGIFCLLGSGLLLCFRSYTPSARLTGYGVIALLLGFRPIQRADALWLTYGLVSVGLGVANALTVNSLGSADEHYANLAHEVRQYYDNSGVVATNSFHLLDLYADIPSAPVTNYDEARRFPVFLWVTLPNFDPGASSVIAMPHPGKEWCEQKRLEAAILFIRCR